MITLYGMPQAGGLRQISPFVAKVEMALRYLNAEYKNESVGLSKSIGCLRMAKSLGSRSTILN